MGIKQYIESKNNKKTDIKTSIEKSKKYLITNTLSDLKKYKQALDEYRVHSVVTKLTPGSDEEKTAKGMVAIEALEIDRAITCIENTIDRLDRTLETIESHKIIDTTFDEFVQEK